jgi:hypothetical protein
MGEIVVKDIYAVMDSDAQEIARRAEKLISDIYHRMRQRELADALEIGRELIAVKAALPHGQFNSWVNAKLGISRSTAFNCMAAAERLGDKCSTVEHLPLNTVYLLAAPSTPDHLRNQIVEKLEAGEKVDAYEIRAEITQATKEQKLRRDKERRKEARSPSAKSRREREIERAQKEANDRAERTAVAAAELVEMLRDRLNDSDFDRLIELLELVPSWVLAPKLREVRA